MDADPAIGQKLRYFEQFRPSRPGPAEHDRPQAQREPRRCADTTYRRWFPACGRAEQMKRNREYPMAATALASASQDRPEPDKSRIYAMQAGSGHRDCWVEPAGEYGTIRDNVRAPPVATRRPPGQRPNRHDTVFLLEP